MRISTVKSVKLQSLQWTKIVVVNLLVFLFLLFVSEIILRSIWTVRSCMQFECDFNRITGLKVRDIDGAADIGISRFR